MLKLTVKVLRNKNLTKSSLTLLKGYSLYLIVRLNTVCIILKSYYVFVDTVKKLFFIVDCAIKCSLFNSVNLFANLFIILFISIVTWASFYMYQTSAHYQFAFTLANDVQTKSDLLLYSIKLAIFIISVFQLASYTSKHQY